MFGPEFLVIWIGWIIAGGSPGPATLGIAGTAMARGRAASLPFALGILAGSASWGIAAALGFSAVMQANVWLFEVLRYAGALYLGWLSFKALRSAFQTTQTQAETPFSGGPGVLFLKGAAIHLTNPKAILSWGSIYAIALPAGAGTGAVFWCFGLLYAGSIFVFIGYALLFSMPAIATAYARARRGFELSFAALFGFASIKILTARLSI